MWETEVYVEHLHPLEMRLGGTEGAVRGAASSLPAKAEPGPHIRDLRVFARRFSLEVRIFYLKRWSAARNWNARLVGCWEEYGFFLELRAWAE